jgi:hypothetical protein
MAEEGPRSTGEPIRVQSDREELAIAQLAARWSEAFAPTTGDAPSAALGRFRVAYEYLDAITHGQRPPDDSRP